MNFLLSLIIFLPLLGGIILLFLPNPRSQRVWALIVTLVTFAVSLVLLVNWQNGEPGMQFVERLPWVPQFNIQYLLGIDGISLWLVMLTTFLAPLVILFSWDSIHERTRAYYFAMLVMETAMLGVFLALDLVLFYVFWEISLVPMYFIIGLWGGSRRIYASVKFFLYTLAGSALMLVAILVMYAVGGTFDVLALQEQNLAYNVQIFAFLAFALAFSIKVPLFPFHTWLPDAHVEAPTAGSVVLAAILLKMGTYGFMRFNLPLFPQAVPVFAPWLIVLAIIGILYGALVALRQPDIKSLIAFSSVAHLGFVVLGIFALNVQGMGGAVLQMVNHGLSTGALFLLVGMLYERLHTRMIADFSGLWKLIPIFGVFFMVSMLSSVGLPGLNGFVGEFTILLGAFQAQPWAAVLGTTGIIFAAWYLLTAYRQTMQGPVTLPKGIATLTDLKWREVLIMVPIVALFVIIGLFPNLFFDKITPSVDALARQVNNPPTALMVEK